ncbi:hypothetical protein DHD05_18895 [Arenibacter sp. N53]|nr:hypothetical protein [Arenibacter sp. N53]
MKKIALTQNDRSKKDYETKVRKVLNSINAVIDQCKKVLNLDISNVSDAVQYIEQYKVEKDLYDRGTKSAIQHRIYKPLVDSFVKTHPEINRDTTMSLFIKEQHTQDIDSIAKQCLSINQELGKMNIGIGFDTLVLNGEFVNNSKIDTKIKDATTIYCTNTKQVEVKRVAEELQEIIHKAIRLKIVSNTILGHNLGNIIDVSTGDINFQYIRRIGG